MSTIEFERANAKTLLTYFVGGRIGDFRQFAARKVDALKLLGAAHGTGAISIALYLATGKASFWAGLLARGCFFLFGVGLGLFVWAFWKAYRWEVSLETILLEFQTKELNLEDEEVSFLIEEAAKNAVGLGPTVAASFIFLMIGGGIAFFGVLFVT